MPDQIQRDLADLLRLTTRVHVFDVRNYTSPARKRRRRAPALADVHDEHGPADLRTALELQPGSPPMVWMCWPTLMLDLIGADGAVLDTVGLLHPEYVSWQPHDDLLLREPAAVARWIARWAPGAAHLWPSPA